MTRKPPPTLAKLREEARRGLGPSAQVWFGLYDELIADDRIGDRRIEITVPRRAQAREAMLAALSALPSAEVKP